MNSTSRAWRLVSIAARSPAFSITGPAVGPDRHAELVGDDVGERRLAEPGRAVEQHVIERFAALLRRGDRDVQVLADALLADVVVERARAQPRLVLDVLVHPRRGDEAIVGHVTRHRPGHGRISAFSASRSAVSNVASGVGGDALSSAFSAGAR